MTDLAQREPRLARTPISAALLPRASYEALAPRSKTATTAVLLDQPLPRYLDLLRLAMPERRKIGVLLGPESSPLAAPLAKAAAARGLQLVTAQVATDQPDLYPALRTVLGDAEVLLALPDTHIYNAGSLQNILITTYRQRVPMVAFSAAYLKAGATLALYVSPAQAASQAATVARGILAGRSLPPPQLASEFSVGINERVAHSLGLNPEAAEALGELIAAAQGLDLVGYTRNPEEAMNAVNEGYSMSFIMNPPTVEDMRQIALGGEKMPQKSTFYYPKILSGLVVWSLADFEA
jgi:hypothetical protein